MSTAPLRYFIELSGRTYPVRDLRGEEGISVVFRYEAAFVLEDPTDDFDPDEVMKKPAALRLERDGILVRRIQGIVTEATLGAATRGAPEVTIVIEPRLALLRHRRDIRLFREQTVPEIVRDVVSALGIKIELQQQGDYERRHYCVQWREADLDYVHRLLEDEGIYYTLTDDDVMVLGDSTAGYGPMAGGARIPFKPPLGTDMNEDAVLEIGNRAALVPGKVTLRDWWPEHPTLNMDVSASPPKAAGAVHSSPEWYDYPGEFIEPPRGERKAKLHAEAFACAAAALKGRSTTGHIAPGAIMKLEGAPAGKDGEYVVTAVKHAWRRDDEGFSNDFEALPADVIYRPARKTYVPVQTNPLTGFVTTQGGQDIFTETYGRVKVHFHWDRLWPYDDTCSYWIPVTQDNTGHSSSVPRRDWEVLVHFLEGDPDRPVVLGRVYNADDTFTERLPTSKTRSGLKSMVSPSRNGSNEIRFDDAKGYESILVMAQKDQVVNVANNRTEDVKISHGTVVKNDDTLHVGGNRKVTVGSDAQYTVSGNQTWKVSGNRKVKIGGGAAEDVAKDRTLTISGNHERESGFDDVVTAKTLTEQISGSVTEKYKLSSRLHAATKMEVTVGASVTETAEQSKTANTQGDRTETVKGMLFTKGEGEHKIRVNKTRKTNVTGQVAVQSEKELALTGSQKISTKSATATFDGSTDITLKVGETIVMLKEGLIKIKTKDTISMLISGESDEGSGKSTQI